MVAVTDSTPPYYSIWSSHFHIGLVLYIHICDIFVFVFSGVIYMFIALAIVCDEFFVPSLDVIIEKGTYLVRTLYVHCLLNIEHWGAKYIFSGVESSGMYLTSSIMAHGRQC